MKTSGLIFFQKEAIVRVLTIILIIYFLISFICMAIVIKDEKDGISFLTMLVGLLCLPIVILYEFWTSRDYYIQMFKDSLNDKKGRK